MSAVPSHAATSSTRAQRWRTARDALVLALALAAGAGATWYAWSLARTTAAAQRDEQLTAACQAIIDSFSLDLVRTVEGVRGASLMVASRRALTRDDFIGYADSLLSTTSAINSLHWIPRVAQANLAAFEAAASRELGRPFRVVEPVQASASGNSQTVQQAVRADVQLVSVRPRAEHFPILYSAPADSALDGVDSAAIPARMAALELSRETEQPTATSLFKRLTPDAPALVGISAPVFARRAGADTSASSGDDPLLGFVAGTISLDDLFREATFRAEAQHLDLQVFDQAADPPELIFSAQSQTDANGSMPAQSAPVINDRHLAVDVAGRPWDIVLHPRADFWASYQVAASRFVLIGGGIATLLLLGFIFSLQRGRRRMEAARNLEARQAHILAASEAGTWEYDVLRSEVQVNERWAAILGYTVAELQPLSVEHLRRLAHPDDVKISAKSMAQHIAGKAPAYGCEMRMRHKDGRWVWVLARGSAVSRSADGTVQRVAGTHLDITAEKELSQQMVDLRTALDVHAIVAITDANGVITYANDKFCEISKYSRAELCGQTHRLINSGHHPREFWDEMWLTISGGNTWKGEIQNCAKDGSRYWVDTTIAPILAADGVPAQYIAIRYDITAQRQLQQALKESEAHWRSMLNEMPVGAAFADAQQRIVFRNDCLVEMLGYNEADTPNLPTWWSRAYPDPEYEQWVHKTWSEAEHTRPDGRIEMRPRIYSVTCKNGEVRQVEISGVRTSDGFLATFVDFTEHQRQQSLLEEATVAAEAASQAKSEFLATMSHEIRTPMNGILGMLQLLEHTELTERQHDYATKAATSTKALLGIINDILDFSKVEAGKLELERSEFLLGNLLRDLSVILSANLNEKPIEVLFDVDAAVPAALIGDALRLRQVLLNLTSNAIKFTERGEVVLSISLRERTVNETGATTVTLKFAVRDTGIGIAPDKLAYIFEGFSQVESSTTRRFGGTGLGLSISKRLVALMGGTLEVESTPGRGSRFHFTAAFTVAASRQERVHETVKNASRMRTLIVDDNATARTVHNHIVASMGWYSESVASGEAALARIEQAQRNADDAPFDIVLVDWHMSGIDGWETARQLRQRLAEGTVRDNTARPIVIMVSISGHDLFATKSRREMDLLDGYLVKPITASMLYDSVVDAQARMSGDAPARKAVGETRRLAGLRLLVVEDNLLNQLIARELLSHDGALIEIAGGGIEGVAKALGAEPSYDAILMDMQMPDIDGLEATRRIRADARMGAIPIIAMTANAMESDKQACRAAGMVDHVSKPIDLEVLVETLLRHVAVPTAQVPAEAASKPPSAEKIAVPPAPTFEKATLSAPSAPSAAPLPASTLLEIDAAVARLGGSRALYDKVLESFKTDAQIQLDELMRHLAEKQNKDAIRCAHTLKGLAFTIGATQLAAAAAGLETALKQGEPNQKAVMQQIDKAAECMREVRALIDQVPAARPATETPAIAASESARLDRVALKGELEALADLLRANNMRSMAQCAQISNNHAAALNDAARAQLQALAAAVNRLDFAKAQTACQILLAELAQ